MTRHTRLFVLAAALAWIAGLLPPAAAPALAASPTLDTVRKRGELVCGVNGLLPGFSAPNAAGKWEGFDVDYCRAVAAGVLGDANKVRYVALNADKRFDALVAGEIDVLIRNSTYTLQRSTGSRMRFAAVNFHDGQAFVIPKGRRMDRARQLAGQKICVTGATTHEANLAAWARLEGIAVETVVLPDQSAMYEAFYDGKCAAITQDMTAMASTIVRAGRGTLFQMLPDIISDEPLGPYVRSGDDGWLDVVRWTHYALVKAEELGIRSANVEQHRQQDGRLQARRLLGAEPGSGRALGLDDAWAFNAIRQVGNYDEIYARNVGPGSPLRFSRGLNSLTKECGRMFAPPM
ncbi:MAG: amino acid ABC transporter substrate-binding protein [Enhydrobacter sp.]|nr:MAG: amino acid ABC transporter substrate-binding protein [Enhydrobacter sp.]